MFLEAALKALPTLHNKGAFNISPTANKITRGIITPGHQLCSDTTIRNRVAEWFMYIIAESCPWNISSVAC